MFLCYCAAGASVLAAYGHLIELFYTNSGAAQAGLDVPLAAAALHNVDAHFSEAALACLTLYACSSANSSRSDSSVDDVSSDVSDDVAALSVSAQALFVEHELARLVVAALQCAVDSTGSTEATPVSVLITAYYSTTLMLSYCVEAS
jgi:hypothetical protein